MRNKYPKSILRKNTIHCSFFNYKGSEHIRLDLLYDFSIKQIVKSFAASSWSQTYRCWYIRKDKALLIQLRNYLSLNGLDLDISQLKKDRLTSSKSILQEEETSVKRSTVNREYQNSISDKTLIKIEEFRQFMEQRRYSPVTIKTYVSFLKQFFSRHCDTEWNEITQDDIRADNYHTFILGKKSYSAQNQSINGLKLFFQFSKSSLVIPEEIERPRKVRYLPNVLTKDEIKSILLSTINVKHRCLLTVVYGGGLRIGEALKLKINDVRFDEKLLYIRHAKGHKDRRVPLSNTMEKLIKDYCFTYRPEEYLFEGVNGGQYSYRSAQHILKRAVIKSGIRIKVTLHTLRHSYATHLLESGVGLRYIQEILGHNSPKTTMIYTHVSGKRITEVRSPLEDLNL